MTVGDLCLGTISTVVLQLHEVASSLVVKASTDDLTTIFGGKQSVMVSLDVYAVVHLIDMVDRMHPHTKGRGDKHELVTLHWHGITTRLWADSGSRCLLLLWIGFHTEGLAFCLHLLHDLPVDVLKVQPLDGLDETRTIRAGGGITCLIQTHTPAFVVIWR